MQPSPTSPDHTNAALEVDVRVLTTADRDAAVNLLARGMRDNPLHVNVFGMDTERRHQRLQRFLVPLVGYVQSNGVLLGACTDRELVGVLGMIQPGRCQPGWIDTLRLAGNVMTTQHPRRVWRIRRWLTTWARNHPAEPHWHFGPMVVRPERRRQGIARQLMTHACRHVDALAGSASLETDLAINAAFYETLGFVVTRHEPVLGVANWFMTRAARTSDSIAVRRQD